MNDKLPSKEEAIQFLHKSMCSRNVIDHCKAVAKLATNAARVCREKGMYVDLELVKIGALLHDIGRSRTHSVHHAVVGAEIAKSLNLPESVISIIKRHVGGGITAETARRLGWPRDVYIPYTVEEKIVSYVDKLVDGARRVPIESTIEKFRSEGLPRSSIQRLRRLHKEMSGLFGDCEW